MATMILINAVFGKYLKLIDFKGFSKFKQRWFPRPVTSTDRRLLLISLSSLHNRSKNAFGCWNRL